jgi:carbon storage regulator
MLILTRKPGEAIIIQDDIKIMYFGLNFYDQAKFGIEAPSEVSAHREEVFKRIMAGIHPVFDKL